jgi:hypothetical protein
MKKQLNTDNIMNELRGGSAHFRPAADVKEETPLAAEAVTEDPVVEEKLTPEIDTSAEEELRKSQASKSRTPRPTRSRSAATATEQVEQAELIETIRKNVKPVGKEATFCRFTPEEKSALGDVVYTYKRNGIRTSENEIVRVAVNWLLENYHTDGKNSVLAQVIDKLNA